MDKSSKEYKRRLLTRLDGLMARQFAGIYQFGFADWWTDKQIDQVSHSRVECAIVYRKIMDEGRDGLLEYLKNQDRLTYQVHHKDDSVSWGFRTEVRPCRGFIAWACMFSDLSL